MLDKCIGVLSVLGLFYYARQVWRRRQRLPARFRCLYCKRLYRSNESGARLDMVFCCEQHEQIHQAEGK